MNNRKYIPLFENWCEQFETSAKINEAILNKDLSRTLDIISNYLTKALGETVIHDRKFEHIKQDGSKEYKGVRFVSLSGNVWRLNWLPTTSNNSSAVANVDFWFSDKPVPDYKVDTTNMNMVQIVAMITHVLKTKGFKINPVDFIKSTYNIDLGYDVLESEQLRMFENLSQEEEGEYQILKAKWYRRKKTPGVMNQAESERYIYLEIKKLGFEDIANEKFGVTEVLEEENIDPIEAAQIERLKARLESQDSTVEQLFKDMDFLVASVIRGLDNSLIITGSPGTGKTTRVKENMAKFNLVRGEDWRLIQGKTSALGLFRTLYAHKDDTILVFDDCDSVWNTEDSRNILKAALDTSDIREVTWLSTNTFDSRGMSDLDIHKMLQKGRTPQSFEITSRIIFVSNITRDDLLANKKMSAIVSRSKSIDITLSDDDMLDYIEALIPDIDIELDIDDKMEVFEVMKTSVKAGVIQTDINIRTYIGMCKAKILAMYMPQDDSENFDWVRLATKYS